MNGTFLILHDDGIPAGVCTITAATSEQDARDTFLASTANTFGATPDDFEWHGDDRPLFVVLDLLQLPIVEAR